MHATTMYTLGYSAIEIQIQTGNINFHYAGLLDMNVSDAISYNMQWHAYFSSGYTVQIIIATLIHGHGKSDYGRSKLLENAVCLLMKPP